MRYMTRLNKHKIKRRSWREVPSHFVIPSYVKYMEIEEDQESLSEKSGESFKNVVQETGMYTIPDGGLTAWLQVIAGHLAVINSWGYITSFGIFQPYYVEKLNKSPSNISWVGSIQVFLMFLAGMFAGRAADAGYTRQVVTMGLVLQLLAVFTTSACKEYWQLILSQGICTGLGNGLSFMSVYATVSTYFKKKRILALCIVSCGTSTGGLIFPAIARTLLPDIGFGWTVRVIGFVMVFNAVLILVLVRPHISPRRDGQLFSLPAFKEPTYALYAIGAFLTFWANFVAYYYIRPYAETYYHISEETSFDLLLVLNGIGILGRLIPAIIADKFGVVNTVIPMTIITGVIMGSWMGVSNMSGTWVFAAFYGFFSAACMGLVPAALPSLSPDPSKNGIRIGMTMAIIGLAGLSGTPIAGKLVQNWHGDYTGTQIFGCVTFLCSSMFVLAARFSKVRFALKKM